MADSIYLAHKLAHLQMFGRALEQCEAWEAENGPYVKGDFMVKSNPRTKGR